MLVRVQTSLARGQDSCLAAAVSLLLEAGYCCCKILGAEITRPPAIEVWRYVFAKRLRVQDGVIGRVASDC